MTSQTNQRIDPKRLWDALMDQARFGATAKGGVRRLTLEATLNATAFYGRAGYRPLARTRSGLGLKCVRMAKLLRPPRLRA